MNQPLPLSICLEDLDAAADDERYLRCVALPGDDQAGLTLDADGKARWMPDGPEAYELWVSADGRLALYRNTGAPPLLVRRAGRSVEPPAQKPVMLLDQDLLQVAGRRLRVHVHGEADEIHEPRFLSARSLARMARAAAAALALSTAVGAAGEAQGAPSPGTRGGQQDIEVRLHPPKRPARVKLVTCDIVSLKPGKKDSVITLKCPTTKRITKGVMGDLLSTKGERVPGTTVLVTKVTRTTVVGKAKFSKLGGARKVQFRIVY